MAKHELPRLSDAGTTAVPAPNKAKFARLIIGYQPALVSVATLLNLFVWGVTPIIPGVPAEPIVAALIVAAVLLVVNHIWLMTATELARLKYDISATPEEWAAAGRSPSDVSPGGVEAVQRCQNAHRNTTENTVIFVLLTGILVTVTPSVLAACVWIGLFGFARLGYTHSYLCAHTGRRGLFMSLSLLALYGMASHLLIGLFVQ